jgi:hypothetical protein
MAQQHLEDQLHEKLRQACEEAKALAKKHKKKFNPTMFIKMLNEQGGFNTACSLLQNDNVGSGFTDLWILGKDIKSETLCFSMEAIILQEPYCQLFSPEQLKIAKKRLTELQYNF